MENREEIEKLKKALQLKQYELENFLQYARQIIRVFDEERLFKTFLSTAMGQTGISRCILRVRAKKHVYVISKGIKLSPHLREALEKGREDIKELLDSFGFGAILELTIASEQTALLFREKGINHLLSLQDNFLAVSFSDSNKLTPENQNYIKALFQITLLAYENILFHRETVERHRLERELEIAREIQQNLLPGEIKIEGFQVAGKSIPSRYVGGDYYDVFEMGDKYLLAIGDVAGKGIPAALLMASIQSSLRAIVSFYPSSLEVVMKELNLITMKNTEGLSFITFFLTLIDPATGDILYSNAGHNPPILVKGNEVVELSEGGMVLGIMENNYSVGREKMGRGDVLFMYTDGLSEASKGGKELGREVLKSMILSMKEKGPEEISSYILEFVKEYTVEDDLTFLIVKRV